MLFGNFTFKSLHQAHSVSNILVKEFNKANHVGEKTNNKKGINYIYMDLAYLWPSRTPLTQSDFTQKSSYSVF